MFIKRQILFLVLKIRSYQQIVIQKWNSTDFFKMRNSTNLSVVSLILHHYYFFLIFMLFYHSHLHIKAKACWRCTWVLWLANCCCWWANVCFIKTILILCSMAYFFAFVTVSCWLDVSRGRDPPKMPSRADLVPGPKATSPVCFKS